MLSAKQVQCLKLMIENPKISGKKLAQTLNVTQKTISLWKNQNAEFQKEYNNLVRKTLQYSAAKALQKEISLTASKNEMVAYLASKDLLDRAGFNPVDKIEQEIDTQISVTVDYGENPQEDGANT